MKNNEVIIRKLKKLVRTPVFTETPSLKSKEGQYVCGFYFTNRRHCVIKGRCVVCGSKLK